MSRTVNSFKNIKYTLIGKISNLVISFIARTFFINYLSAEYLGINGLFTNILSILSIAELGIGSAIVYSIYEPLVKKQEERLLALMNLYKKSYTLIGMFIIVVGFSLTPFLHFFIKEMPDIQNIQIIYLIFVLNSGLSYFFSYKRALIIADQKKYIDSIYHFGTLFVLNIVQIFVLVLTQNYFVFLVLRIVATVIENLMITLKINKMYPILSIKNKVKLNPEDKKSIIKNIKAMFLHKIGYILVLGTDNLLLAKFVGIISVGIYSNYLLIISALQTVFGIIFQSITASVGNLGATENKERVKEVFNLIDFVGYWLYGFASISLLILLNPFISLWIGSEYTFELPIVLLIVLNFYIQGQRRSVLTFRDALGLFWYDRYKPMLETVINLVFSIYLAIEFGVLGVILGTIISTLSTSTWIEPYVLYKYGFKISMKEYLIKYSKRILLITVIGLITLIICNLLVLDSIGSFIFKMAICTLVPNLLLTLVHYKSCEFKSWIQIFKRHYSW